VASNKRKQPIKSGRKLAAARRSGDSATSQREREPPSALDADSIGQVLQRLILFAQRTGNAFASVQYDSEYARQIVIARLKAELSSAAVVFHEVTLPTGLQPVQLGHEFVDRLKALAPGVVSVCGFHHAFAPGPQLEHDLSILNFRREDLAVPHLRQIWWLASTFAERFTRAVPDLNSWFLTRLRLSEIILPPDRSEMGCATSDAPAMPLDEARFQVAGLLQRFHHALTSGEARDEELFQLAVDAIRRLYAAGAKQDADDLRLKLARQMRDRSGLPSDAKPTSWSDVAKYILRTGERATPPNRPAFSNLARNLADMLREIGDLDGAKTLYERAIEHAEAAFGPDHPEVASTVNRLGIVIEALGDLLAAKLLFERALRIDEKAYGPVHPNVARDVNNLGSVLKHLGDLAGAKAAFERALNIDEQAFGTEHPKVAIRVNNLGRVLQDLGDFAGAKAAYERALKIDEQAFGPEHPEVATDVNNLGAALQALGDLAGAKAAYERALKIDEQAFGPEHPNVATGVNNLGRLYEQMRDLAQAKAFYERAWTIFRKFLGDEHPSTRRASGARERVEKLMAM
jgi:tetratricopeptide (TPR) repeat protein